MNKNLEFAALIFALASFNVYAGTGPTSIGNITIGMSKAQYVSAIGINPVDCSAFKDNEGKSRRSEMKYLDPERKTLCWSYDFDKTGSIESIHVGGLSYDVIEANYDSSKFIATIGHSSKAIFFKDRLISLTITFPKAGLQTLVTKYGEPKLVDGRKMEVCKNRLGSELKNSVGKLDAVWINGAVEAILRAATSPPQKTCTDGITIQYYILEEPAQIRLIESAIVQYRNNIAQKEAKDSPF